MPLSSLSRSRLLLVEDDRMVRETIVLMLEDDYEVLLSDSIKAALAYLRTPEPAPIEVILLDCLLPDGNLADVLAEADLKSIPVVLISGDPRQAEAMDPSRQFLPKPFTQATLLKILDTARG
jgi:DNA-binding NtrC family response regulator